MGGRVLEKPHDSQFAADALVAVELGVGLAFFPDQNQLGAESEEGEGALEDRELVGAREILAFPGAQGEIDQSGWKKLRATVAEVGPGAQLEALRQGMLVLGAFPSSWSNYIARRSLLK